MIESDCTPAAVPRNVFFTMLIMPLVSRVFALTLSLAIALPVIADTDRAAKQSCKNRGAAIGRIALQSPSAG